MARIIHFMRWPLLAVAWLAFLVSLLLPFFSQPFVFAYMSYTPVGIILLAAFEAPFADPLTFLMVSGTVCFLATPLLATILPETLWARAIRWAFLALLLSPWALPVAAEHMTPKARYNYGLTEPIRFGYYLFAGAHTLAFFACLLAPRRLEKASNKRGFAVVPQDPGA